jgi:hypothetical protein
MKRETRKTELIEGNHIKVRRSEKGWAIIIIPPHARIDNFHGYAHIHFTPKGEKIMIKDKNFNEIYETVRLHLKANKKLIENQLLEDLK